MILANIAAFVLETVEPIHSAAPAFFRWFEIASVAVFTVEYLLRLWSCTASPNYADSLGRLRFALTPMAIVDLLAILPFYLPFAASVVATRSACGRHARNTSTASGFPILD
ncbi:MAG: ion transporter [Pirellulales bacterium]